MKVKLRSYVNVKHQLHDQLEMAMRVLLVIWGLMLLASWTWELILPRPPSAMPTIELGKNDLTESILVSHWFGNKGSSTTFAEVNFKLVGTFSPTASKGGFAIIKMPDGKQRVVLLKQEIVPGMKLETLGADYIGVLQAGKLTKILLENRKTPAIPVSLKSDQKVLF
jgi:hypothetical protein